MFNSTTNTNGLISTTNTNANSSAKSVLKKVALVALIATASMSAQANDLNSQDMIDVLETRLSETASEMLQSAKQEIVLSLHSQIAEQAFELNSSLELAETASDTVSETTTDSVLASNED
ncbi:hypothetical protein Q4601_16700 [Shewanella sp. 1_MG-2023]|uniref:Orphan protein n=1 Tax=Shewanella electrodiphila TaxID=934143 RepID=A0ABT0KPB8_9GAMM|nr:MULTISPECIES: hypothetical protein [Shewanella]MCC4834086.1 hypothetical protein [Shewanella sp. 10N.7]MCL1045692.1 hypothetical protein [Shewanella electrodiphila]MDO6613465.1 hypothetical protein [Shewanella sp. 7_MG-2023]MDO6773295.1 hypothetical protein [Shewanella sp. 2_MG-2023]MDO6795946.1 hypothetical protein [Shewanella sp. 1_MG-2023]